MSTKIDTKKRVRIHKTKLWEIKKENQHFNDEAWFNVFVNKFSLECGLKKTSIRSSRSRSWKYGTTNTNETYYFKITDKNKYLLGKIKYGF